MQIDSSNKLNLILIISGVLVGIILNYLFVKYLLKTFLLISQKIDENIETVNFAGKTISSSSIALATTTNQQSSAIQEMSSTSEELKAMTEKNLYGTKQTHHKMLDSITLIKSGQNTIQTLLKAMDTIKDTNESSRIRITKSNEELEKIVQLILEIGQKTKVIDDIVFQTKLLSFNASVEAARAGEHGKGFAVVAEEVGNLAQMSGKASREISEMLLSSSSQIEELVSKMRSELSHSVDETEAKVNTGSNIAHQCNDVFEKIYELTNEVSVLISEVASASNEQFSGVSEMNNAIQNVDSGAQDISTISKDSEKLSVTLNQSVDSLKGAIAEFNSVIYGAKS